MNSTIQERLIDIQSDDETRVVFWMVIFGIKCSESDPEFGSKWSYYWRFQRRILLTKVSSKQPNAHA